MPKINKEKTTAAMKSYDDGLAAMKVTDIAYMPKYLTHDNQTVRCIALQRYHMLIIKQTDDLAIVTSYFTNSDCAIRIVAKKRYEELSPGLGMYEHT